MRQGLSALCRDQGQGSRFVGRKVVALALPTGRMWLVRDQGVFAGQRVVRGVVRPVLPVAEQVEVASGVILVVVVSDFVCACLQMPPCHPS